MKKIFPILVAAGLAGSLAACTKSDFSESYADPSKVSTASLDKQFAGFVYSNNRYNIPSYWNYFVVLRTTLQRFNQAVGWENGDNQYVPGQASINERWNDYYYFLAQYREMEKIYNTMSDAEKNEWRIYMITATIFLYDHTQKTVDIHGDIPFSMAGMLSTNGGDYTKSRPKYDDASAIYTKMLDDLKGFSTELNTIVVGNEMLKKFGFQDLLNRGNLSLWKKYNNSLRLRLLTRVSGVPAFQARVNSEMAEILGTPATYPVVNNNSENIRVNVQTLDLDVNAKGFRTGLEDWFGNIAGKKMIDHMKANNDPRLRAMFEPGANAGGVYNGLDPLLNRQQQNTLINGGTLAIYNRSTLSRNEYFPGIMITAAEVSFMAAEYYLKASNNAAAKTAYENGITQSIEYYYWLRSFSNNNDAGPLTPTDATQINNYKGAAGVSWDNAATNADKLRLIATQKWIHYSVVQPVESWAEIRRLDAPTFQFETDNANAQKQPPMRWVYPAAEQTYNAANYEVVKGKDNLSTKIFWDLQ